MFNAQVHQFTDYSQSYHKRDEKCFTCKQNINCVGHTLYDYCRRGVCLNGMTSCSRYIILVHESGVMIWP